MNSVNTKTNMRSVIPQVLLQYLFDMAVSSGAGQHYFRLSVEQLGVGRLQEIEHLPPYVGEPRSHKVFGFEPVEGELLIHCDGSECIVL